MRTLIDFAIREEYSRVKALGDDLSDINSLINWDRFRFLEPLIYKNKTSRGGRPNIEGFEKLINRNVYILLIS